MLLFSNCRWYRYHSSHSSQDRSQGMQARSFQLPSGIQTEAKRWQLQMMMRCSSLTFYNTSDGWISELLECRPRPRPNNNGERQFHSLIFLLGNENTACTAPPTAQPPSPQLHHSQKLPGRLPPDKSCTHDLAHTRQTCQVILAHVCLKFSRVSKKYPFNKMHASYCRSVYLWPHSHHFP